jgi:hypothetical protein
MSGYIGLFGSNPERQKPFLRQASWLDEIKIENKNKTVCRVVEWSHQDKGYFEHSNDTSGSAKGEGFFDQLRNYQFQK